MLEAPPMLEAPRLLALTVLPRLPASNAEPPRVPE